MIDDTRSVRGAGMKVKCDCGWEYNMDTGDEDWEECPNCDLPYKHIRTSKWISVEDRLPKDNKTQIIYSKEYGVIMAYLDLTNKYWWSEHDNGGEYYRNGGQLWDVTHWQPLPDPPEVNDE